MWSDKHGTPLSFGSDVYQPDRYGIVHPYPRDWNLEIKSVRNDDNGIYECRIGTHPPVTKTVHLIVRGKTKVMSEGIYLFCTMTEALKVL